MASAPRWPCRARTWIPAPPWPGSWRWWPCCWRWSTCCWSPSSAKSSAGARCRHETIAGERPGPCLRPRRDIQRHRIRPERRRGGRPGRTFRLRQDHSAAPVRRPAGCAGRADRERLRQSRQHVPATQPAALENHPRQHCPGPEGPRHRQTRAAAAGRSLGAQAGPGAWRPGQVSAPAVGRHAEPRFAGPGAGTAAGPAAARRTLRRAGHRPQGRTLCPAAGRAIRQRHGCADDHPRPDGSRAPGRSHPGDGRGARAHRQPPGARPAGGATRRCLDISTDRRTAAAAGSAQQFRADHAFGRRRCGTSRQCPARDIGHLLTSQGALKMLKLSSRQLTDWPVLLCSFRPLFLVTVLLAMLGIALWLGFLGLGMPLPPVPGGPLMWHAPELLLGFGLAAVAGFVLTAVPEFTATAPFGRRVGLTFVSLWLAARLTFWLSGPLGPWPAALCNLGFALALPLLLTPRLLRDPLRRQWGFFGGLS